jgi:hypothetical protein
VLSTVACPISSSNIQNPAAHPSCWLQHMETRAAGAAELQLCCVQEAIARQQGAAEASAAFEAYAADVIAQAAAAGKATKPMQLYLRRALQPEGLMPSDEL